MFRRRQNISTYFLSNMNTFSIFFAYGLHPPSHPPRSIFTRNSWALPFYYFSEIQTLPINMRVQGEGFTLSYSKAVWCCVWLFSRKQCPFTKNLLFKICIDFFEYSAVNLMVGWNSLRLSINSSTVSFLPHSAIWKNIIYVLSPHIWF